MNTQKIAHKILPLYRLDPLRPPSLLREGVDNDMYVFTMTDGSRGVLRLNKRDMAEAVDFEVKLLNFLFEHQVPVPEILPTTKGNPWVVVDGVTAVAFHFISGTTILVEHNTKPDVRYARFAGEVLARLHVAGLSFAYQNPKRRTIFTEYERALLRRDFIIKLKGGPEFLTIVESYLKWARQFQGDMGIIHNDFIPSNIIFNKDKATVVDFDWSCRGPLIKDLGIALAEWSLPDGLNHHWEEIFISFLEGYNKSAPKKIPLDNNLYKWICFSCLSDACTFFADLPADSHINEISQCRRFKKFIYFEKYL
jgi:Ser/Thr protein kinase RdoA (MazF antagonist)